MNRGISKELDETDIAILRLLQEDCKRSIKDISKKVGKGISTVHSRIKSLEEVGAIRQYTAILNREMLGRSTLAYILVTVRYHTNKDDRSLSQREFCNDIAGHHFVQEVQVLSGEFDVMLKVRTSDVQELNRFIVDFLRNMPAVDRTLTMFAMDSYLETMELRNLGLPSD